MRGRWSQILGFYVLTFVLLAVVPLLHGLFGSGPMDFDAAAARASEKTGLPWTSNLVVVLRLSLAEPMLWLLVLGAAVPSLAALVMCAVERPSRLGELFGRFRLGVSWRRALGSYGLLMVLMVVGLITVYALRSFLPGPEYSQPAGLFGSGLVMALLAAAFLDQGAVLEELGWRGYAQPRLQAGLLDPLKTALLIGVGWGLWHVPRDVFAGVIERLGVGQYLFLYLPSFVLGTVTISIVAAYFVNRCGGSVWPAIMVHGLGNDAVGLSGSAPMEVALTPYHQITKAAPFAVIAIGLVIFAGRRLGLEGEPS